MSEHNTCYSANFGASGVGEAAFSFVTTLPAATVERIERAVEDFNHGLGPDDPPRMTRDQLLDRAVRYWMDSRGTDRRPRGKDDDGWLGAWKR